MRPYIPLVAPRFLHTLSRIAPIRIAGIALWPFVVSREPMTGRLENHERIHVHQQLELAIAGGAIALTLAAVGVPGAAWLVLWAPLPVVGLFFVLYGVFHVWGWIRTGSPEEAYNRNPFETEAYANDDNLEYLKSRPAFAWLRG